MADSTAGNVTGGSSTDPTGSTSTGGNIVKDIGNLFSATTPLASTALGLYNVGQAKQEYKSAADKLAGLGQPYVDAGQKVLADALAGNLTPAQQQQIDLLKKQSETLTGEATPFLSIGTYDIQQSQAGQLPQWQQQQLENQKAAAIAQATAALGPNADSSALTSVINNINQQYAIQQGNLAQQNLATGESVFNLGANLQTQGMQAAQAAANAPIVDQQQAFATALNLAAGGNQPVEASVQTMLAGDQLIAQELQAFMQALGTSGASGSISNIGTAFGNLFKDIFGGSSGDSSGSTDSGGTPA